MDYNLEICRSKITKNCDLRGVFFIAYLIYGMGKPLNLPKDKYGKSVVLLEGKKHIREHVIRVDKTKKNQINFIVNEEANLEHISEPEELYFQVEVRKDNFKSFKFKITCRELHQSPFFRFDSDGDSHRNYDDSTPLKEQKVETPHFHKFDENGVLIAYQTELLKKESERKALEDINFCACYFFQESNTNLNEHEYPEIKIFPDLLDLEMTDEDPNAGVNFI